MTPIAMAMSLRDNTLMMRLESHPPDFAPPAGTMLEAAPDAGVADGSAMLVPRVTRRCYVYLSRFGL
jgi:hypothetical protein